MDASKQPAPLKSVRIVGQGSENDLQFKMYFLNRHTHMHAKGLRCFFSFTLDLSLVHNSIMIQGICT